MNTSPSATTVLCYGDSNTYGFKPNRISRYAADERWPGVLRKQLGDGYYVIEEGLNGRTTDLPHHNPLKANRNGLDYFKACIESHMPLDIIIIMLGTNDLKTVYNRSAEDIARALKQYQEYVKVYCDNGTTPMPRIIFVSPAYVDDTAPKFYSSMPTQKIYDETSVQKSHELAAAIRAMASETGCEFFDAAPITKVGQDGLHLDLESHVSLGEMLAKLIN